MKGIRWRWTVTKEADWDRGASLRRWHVNPVTACGMNWNLGFIPSEKCHWLYRKTASLCFSLLTTGGFKVCVCAQSCPTLCDPTTVARQAPLSMGLSNQEHRSGFPFPPPGDLPSQGIEPASPGFPTLAGRFFITEPPRKPRLLRLRGSQTPNFYQLFILSS